MAYSITKEEVDFETHISVNLYTSSGCAIILSILLSLDVIKAFQRKALWIPGQALVLTALIIQLLTYVDNFLNLHVNSDDSILKDEQMVLLVGRPLIFDSRRVMICIFIAYLLPGVVRSETGLKTVWGNIGALALPVMWHMGYEVYFLLQEIEEEKSWIPSAAPAPPSPPHPKIDDDAYTAWQQYRSDRIWFRASYITFFTALTLLIVHLICGVIAGKSIRKIMSHKIPLALSCCSNCPEEDDCNDIQIYVLKCFIVTRASQPDYIIARSVFSAFAGIVNTVCFLFIVVRWIWISHYWLDPFFYFQFVFILIGWIVLFFRWFTAVLYFPKNVWCLFHEEDFWTRSIIDMKNYLDAHLTATLIRKKRILERIPKECIVAAVRLHSLFLIMGLWLLKLMVLVSKVCWCLSDLAFRMIRPFIVSPLSALEEADPFHKYKEALEIIRMPGEIAYSLWIANQSAFKKAQNSIYKGYEKSTKGTACAELIALMECRNGTVEDETPTSLEVEKRFKDVGVKSWKMRAVSSIHFMIYFYDYDPAYSKIVKDSIEAYSQAWCFMDLVDNLDPEGHLVSLAADKEFYTIENIWKKNLQGSNVSNSLWISLQEKNRILKQLMDQLTREEQNTQTALSTEGQNTRCEDKLHDSQDWMAMAANISLYKTWKAKDLKSNPVNAIHDLRCLLAKLIAHCIGPELDKAVIENCGRWAKDGKEKEIMNAAFVVGQAKAVRERVPNLMTC